MCVLSKCFFSHKWVVVRKVGIHTYSACRKCGRRKVEAKSDAGYQPVDHHWLITGEYSKPINPPVKP